jgi:protein gp37
VDGRDLERGHRLHDLAGLSVPLRGAVDRALRTRAVHDHPAASGSPGPAAQGRQPRRIFVNNMSDPFQERVPDDFIARRRHRADRTPPFAASLDAHAATITA